jgi:hypothetical protein
MRRAAKKKGGPIENRPLDSLDGLARPRPAQPGHASTAWPRAAGPGPALP